MRIKIDEIRKRKFLAFRIFVLYYIYGSVWAIPTYRVYRLYDNDKQVNNMLCVHFMS